MSISTVAFVLEGPDLGQSALCAPVFAGLGEWFALDWAVQNYLRDIEQLPTIVARVDGQVVGFFTVKQHYAHSAEAYVLGVLPGYHRLGIGRAMLARAEEYLREQGVEFLQVKTLGPSNEDPGYARTRAFYEGVGFRPLEEFTQIWGEENPCLIMVKWIGP